MEQNDDIQRVEVETETNSARSGQSGPGQNAGAGRGFAFRFGRVGSGGFHSFMAGDPDNPQAQGKPPAVAAWICLVLAWLFLGSSVPFTVLLGVPLALIAILLGAVCLSRGGMFTGLSVLLLGSAGSFIVYLVGLFRFLAG